MGDMADDMRNREEDDDFDTVDESDPQPVADVPVKQPDPVRPEARRGRYYLPHPETGKTCGWRRTTNFTKPFEDTYHLELWKQRNVARGIGILIEAGRLTPASLVASDVKVDKARLNKITETAQDVAEAYKLADEGTALHESTELVDFAGGDLNRAPENHRKKMRLYLDALAANGLKVVPDMIERVTVSTKYNAAGKLDRIYRLSDGSMVIGDLKTGDNLDLSFPGIAAQLQCYEDGVNAYGVFDGYRYSRIRVRQDFGIVVHLPSTRDEVTVYRVDLNQGRLLNELNTQIFEARKVKAKHVAEIFNADVHGMDRVGQDQHWIEQMNAAHTYAQLVNVAERARAFGQWNQRLADVARNLAAEVGSAEARMGS